MAAALKGDIYFDMFNHDRRLREKGFLEGE
jgi:hypothetical protein